MNLTEYLRELKVVKPGDAPEDVASSSRINAIQTLLRALVRGDNIVSGLNIVKKSQDGWVIISGEPSGSIGSVSTFPFKLSASGRGNVLGVKIEAGTITDQSPFVSDDVLGNVKLDNTIQPILDVESTNGIKPILIRCDMTSPGASAFQGMLITAATMQSSYNPDAEPTPPVPGGGFRIFWDDSPVFPAPHTIGHFYVKIGEVTVANSSITTIKQLVSTNMPSIILAGEDVAVVMPLL